MIEWKGYKMWSISCLCLQQISHLPKRSFPNARIMQNFLRCEPWLDSFSTRLSIFNNFLSIFLWLFAPINSASIIPWNTVLMLNLLNLILCWQLYLCQFLAAIECHNSIHYSISWHIRWVTDVLFNLVLVRIKINNNNLIFIKITINLVIFLGYNIMLYIIYQILMPIFSSSSE